MYPLPDVGNKSNKSSLVIIGDVSLPKSNNFLSDISSCKKDDFWDHKRLSNVLCHQFKLSGKIVVNKK